MVSVWVDAGLGLSPCPASGPARQTFFFENVLSGVCHRQTPDTVPVGDRHIFLENVLSGVCHRQTPDTVSDTVSGVWQRH